VETDPHDHTLLRLLYVAGLRVSEACALRWRDLAPRDAGAAGQVTVFGRGGKTRVVLLPPGVWREVSALRGPGGARARTTPCSAPRRAGTSIPRRSTAW
jgi:integrase/recombinase XerD